MSLMEDAARTLKVALRPIEVESLGELEGALSVAALIRLGES